MNTPSEHLETIDEYMDKLIAAAKHGTSVEILNARADLGSFMLRTLAANKPAFVTGLHVGSPLTGNAPVHDQTRQGHLPPGGTREDVLARTLASFMFRTLSLLSEQPGAKALYSKNWQEAQFEALRLAFPVLGTLGGATLDETA